MAGGRRGVAAWLRANAGGLGGWEGRAGVGTEENLARMLAARRGALRRIGAPVARGLESSDSEGGLLAAACVLIGIVIGFRDYLEPYVHQDPRYDRELKLEWAGPMPEWLQLADNRHILRDIERRARPAPTDRLLDPNLASRIGHCLLDLSDPADQSAGWIERVERVTVRPNGVVAVACRFRQPTAWVLRRGYCYLIDDKAVRLPGRYDPSDCTSSRLMMIDGVRRPPPAVGQSWVGADLRAGLKLVALLVDPYMVPQVAELLIPEDLHECPFRSGRQTFVLSCMTLAQAADAPGDAAQDVRPHSVYLDRLTLPSA